MGIILNEIYETQNYYECSCIFLKKVFISPPNSLRKELLIFSGSRKRSLEKEAFFPQVKDEAKPRILR